MTNVAEFPWTQADTTPERIALRCADEQWSYARLRERIAAVGGALQAAGVAPGDRVLLVAPSVPEFAAAYYGIHAAGAIVVAVNPMATHFEIDHVVADAGCSHALAWHECSDVAKVSAEIAEIPLWRLRPGLEELPGGAPLAAAEPKAGEDVAVILYTSGTTGRPKGAELTHGNITACADAFVEVLRATPDDRFGTALPLFHIFGGAVIMGTAMRIGASLSLLPKFGALETIEMIASDEVTVFAGVPTMYNAILQASEAIDRSALATLRLCASGGASLPEEVLRAFADRLGVTILEGYGMTETTGAATFNGLGRERKPGMVGLPLPGMAVKVVDAEGTELPIGEVGEVLFCGPVVMRGYRNRPEATAETVVDGWIHTGDLGTIDADGDLRIVDRKKDLIIRGGYNVYPREVEEVLYEHPDIVEVAVVGVPHDHYGEEVAAVVALRPGLDGDPVALRAWAKERLSAYKAPRLFSFVDVLPKGPTGKILKREIDRDALVVAAQAPDPTPAGR